MKKIGLLCLALVLALGSMGGAIAYFSDTEMEAMTFSAGELNLVLGESETGPWHDDNPMTWSIGPEWAPGDVTESITYAANVGTTGGQIYGFKVVPNDYTGSRMLLDNTFITDWKFTWGGRLADTSIWGQWCIDLWDADADGNVSLGEFMDSPYGPVIYLDYEGTGDILGPAYANIEKTTIYFQFNPDAGNPLMNKTATIDFTFKLFDGWPGVHHVGEVSPAGYGYVEME